MTTLSSDQWSQYWQKGTITTFHRKFENNYDGSIKDHWFSEFADLAEGSSVIDLATGNGALLSLLNDFAAAEKKRFSATGVDFAALHQDFFSGLDAIDLNLLEQTAIEQMPVPDGSFDLAISQYGLEYADIDMAVRELARVCKPTARISFIMHHEDSQIIREGHQSLQQIALVNEELKFVPLIRKMLDAIEQWKKRKNPVTQKKADKQRDRLNQAIMQLRQAAASFDDPSYLQFFHDNALAVFNPSMTGNMSHGEKIKTIRLVEKETHSLQGRMQDLTSVAMTAERNQQLTEGLKNYGFGNIQIKDLHYNGFQIGQLLTAERNV